MANDYLLQLSLRVHSVYKTLHCISCQTVHLPGDIVAHLNTHDIRIPKKDISKLVTSLTDLQAEESREKIRNPPPGGPPVECLPVVQEGHCCNQCNYCVPALTSFRNHWSSAHKDDLTPANESFHLGVIQTFFKSRRQSWFEVIPSLVPSPPSVDLFEVYMQQQVPKFKETLVNEPIHVREIPPFLQVTGWHLHLEKHLKTRQGIKNIRSLVYLPTLRDNETSYLHNLVLAYMKDIRHKNQNSSLAVRSILMECPR